LSDRFASLPKRVGVAIVAVPTILLLAYMGGFCFFLLVALISSLSLYEFYRMAELKGVFPQKSVGLIFGFLLNLAFIYDRLSLEILRFFESYGINPAMFSLHQFLLFVLLLFLLSVAVVELFRRKGSPIQNAGTTVLGVSFLSLFFGTLIQIRELFPFGFPVAKFFPQAIADQAELAQIDRWGGFTIIAIFAAIWICDTAAYFGGMTLGRHKLFERVSPNKTWEGAIFGFVFSIVTMLAAKYLLLGYMGVGHAIVMGMIIGCFGQIGDLVESRFKRDAGVKDSSSIIPGHGGVYDRFDSLVFVSPILYLYIDFVILS
jgi:phosphatidate cytidylyltransferase